MKKPPLHFTARVEIEQQISFFSFGFARVSEVRHVHLVNKCTLVVLTVYEIVLPRYC